MSASQRRRIVYTVLFLIAGAFSLWALVQNRGVSGPQVIDSPTRENRPTPTRSDDSMRETGVSVERHVAARSIDPPNSTRLSRDDAGNLIAANSQVQLSELLGVANGAEPLIGLVVGAVQPWHVEAQAFQAPNRNLAAKLKCESKLRMTHGMECSFSYDFVVWPNGDGTASVNFARLRWPRGDAPRAPACEAVATCVLSEVVVGTDRLPFSPARPVGLTQDVLYIHTGEGSERRQGLQETLDFVQSTISELTQVLSAESDPQRRLLLEYNLAEQRAQLDVIRAKMEE